MAKGRMLDKSISLSRKANRLTLKSALIYTWAISHLDDWALLSNDSEVIKATCCPMKKEIKVSDIQSFILEAQIKDDRGESLITEFEDCLLFNAFDDHQKLSPEKRAKPTFQKIPKNPQESPGDFRNPQETPIQEKGSEYKGREDKLLRKEQALEFNNFLFQGLKDVGIQIQDAANERTKYPSLFRRKNTDPKYWLALAKFSQNYGFKDKNGDWINPWKGPVKLSKLYYEIRAKYDDEKLKSAGIKTYADMKKVAMPSLEMNHS